jgi:hypothetical protein
MANADDIEREGIALPERILMQLIGARLHMVATRCHYPSLVCFLFRQL